MTRHVPDCRFLTRPGLGLTCTDACQACFMAGRHEPTIFEVAAEYRRQHQLPQEAGYVIFWNDKPCGWTLDREPGNWRPGCLSVDRTTVWWAEGGSYEAGAERWVAR